MENVKMPDSFAVEIKNLSFAYGKDSALKNVSLKIRSGERFGIIGPSGAGKSTLLLHLNGILSGDGEVKIDGLPVIKESLPEIRRKVGLVFQNPDDQLFNPTVEEDVAFGPLNLGLSREEVEARVRETLKQMNLEGFETKTSHHLSYGEQKRVALATVLAMQPEVVAFDEPFSNLDPAMVKHLIEIIESLDATVILVSQQILPVMACCHRLAILKDGQVIRVGTPAELA
ncbi:unnamed protein product, partial [marine sediment metagenome]